MTDALKTSIENLYTIFSRYPFPHGMEGCTCCVSDEDKARLRAKPLRQLEDEHLARYSGKAMTTWGEADDFKHYLPRILELLTKELLIDTTVFGKLDYGKWRTWPHDEQEAIRQFLIEWWANTTKNGWIFESRLIEFYRLLGDIDPLLEKWDVSFENNSFINYVDFLHDNFYDVKNRRSWFKELDDNAADKLLVWLMDRRELVEKGFFHYEPIDPKLAEKISNTLYMMERV